MKTETKLGWCLSFRLMLLQAFLAGGFLAQSLQAQAFTTAYLADGFDFPVGPPDGYGYYIFRGFTQNGHLGEDWNGNGGGDSDLGDPVYSMAHGVVVFSEDYKKGWGNVIIVRHAYRGNNGQINFVDSLYGHLNVRLAKVGERVARGQKIGTIGKGPHGMYTAHLHFEIRRDLRVGMRRDLYPKTYATYTHGGPRTFINNNRKLRFEDRLVRVPINTFQRSNPNTMAVSSIEPPKISPEGEVRPVVPDTIGSIISEQTNADAAKPEASQSLLDLLFKK